MFRRLEDFLKTWKDESANTLKLFDAIPDKALETKVTAEHRDLRRMAWHLVETILEMSGHLGLRIEGAELIQGGFIVEPPATMKAIREAYLKASESLLEALQDWKDEDLDIVDEMYGEQWKRGFTLFVISIHQTHHRGQMTVLMRQAGLVVPGIYGPAKEGWAVYGVEAPKV